MPLITTLAGGAMGVSLQLYTNAVRRLPLMRHPWEHVLYFGVGGWAANKLVTFEAEQSEELRRTLERQGRPAMQRE